MGNPDNIATRVNRRSFLKSVAGAAGAFVLAACGGSNNNGPQSAPTVIKNEGIPSNLMSMSSEEINAWLLRNNCRQLFQKLDVNPKFDNQNGVMARHIDATGTVIEYEPITDSVRYVSLNPHSSLAIAQIEGAIKLNGSVHQVHFAREKTSVALLTLRYRSNIPGVLVDEGQPEIKVTELEQGQPLYTGPYLDLVEGNYTFSNEAMRPLAFDVACRGVTFTAEQIKYIAETTGYREKAIENFNTWK